jgi:DNA-binding winged helix-turn-helix (wHTH) protein/lipoprotein NlpI
MTPPQVRRFGAFEIDCLSGELRKHGLRIRLAEQPFKILVLLLERRGEVVSREEIRKALWPADTFVDFDAGLSSAVRKLREALGDSAAQPRFIETVPRRGYRFLAPVTEDIHATEVPEPSPAPRRTLRPAALALVLVVALALVPFAVMRNRPRDDGEANAAFLKGVEAMGRQNVAGFRAAAAYFQQAAALRPDSAPTYAWLAQAHLQLVYAGQFAPRDVVPRADLAVRRALALDDRIALAHRVRASILREYYWQWDAAKRESERAQQLEPIAPASEVDPLSAQGALNAGVRLRDAGQFDGALDAFRRAAALNPQIARAHYQIGVTYALMSRWRDAADALQRAVQMSPDNTRFLAYRGYAAAKAGDTEDARRILQDLCDRRSRQYVSSFGLAVIYDALGDRDAAAAALERAYQERALEFAQWSQYPLFASAQLDPRYENVLRRVNAREPGGSPATPAAPRR